LQQFGTVALDEIEQLIGGTLEVLIEFGFRAHQFAQPYDIRRIGLEPVKAVQIGAQRIGQDVSIPVIIFGASRAEAIAEAVELFGIEGENAKPRSRAASMKAPRGVSNARATLAGCWRDVSRSRSRKMMMSFPSCSMLRFSRILPAPSSTHARWIREPQSMPM
jgi:hypothetical protein